MSSIYLAIVLCLFLVACSGGSLGSVSKTHQLYPGMTVNQVNDLLGPSESQQFVAGRRVFKYSLHQYWKGWVPYYLAFHPETDRLDSW